MSTSTAASSNNISSAFIAELQQEGATTRKILERIPSDKFEWKPHEKSYSMKQLAVHVAEMFGWTPPTVLQPELDFSKMDYKPADPKDTTELVELMDKNLAEAIDALKNTTDEAYGEPWSLRNGETIYFTMPRIAVMRGMVMSHIIHHRGQLSVYLRLNDIPVPPIYGPSADEGQM